MLKPVSVRTLHLGLLSTLIALVATLIMTMSVSAHTAPGRALSSPARGEPVVRIVDTRKGSRFHPHKVHISLRQTDSVEFENETNATQVILDSSNTPILTLQPEASGEIHFNAKGTFVYHLQSNPKAKVTVIVS